MLDQCHGIQTFLGGFGVGVVVCAVFSVMVPAETATLAASAAPPSGGTPRYRRLRSGIIPEREKGRLAKGGVNGPPTQPRPDVAPTAQKKATDAVKGPADERYACAECFALQGEPHRTGCSHLKGGRRGGSSA